MKRLESGEIEFTNTEEVILMAAASHGGLVDMSKRWGEFSRANLPGMSNAFVNVSRALLDRFYDWKISTATITQWCKNKRLAHGLQEKRPRKAERED